MMKVLCKHQTLLLSVFVLFTLVSLFGAHRLAVKTLYLRGELASLRVKNAALERELNNFSKSGIQQLNTAMYLNKTLPQKASSPALFYSSLEPLLADGGMSDSELKSSPPNGGMTSLEIKGVARYESILRFLASLETLNYITDLEGVELAESDEGTGLRYRIQVHVYCENES